MRRRAPRAAIGATALACVVLAAAVAPPAPTDAAWTDLERGTGAFSAGAVTPVTQMTCAAGLLQPVEFTWTAPVGGLTRSGYRWTVTGGINGSGVLTAAATTVSLSSGLLGIGSGTFSLYAVGPGGWESTAKTGTLSFTTGLLSSCNVA